MDRNQAIQNVMATHTLPRNIAEQVVDDAGNVDQSKLQIALTSVGWGRTPASSADPGLAQALSNAYHEAKERRDVAAMMRLTDALFKIGASLLPRKS